MDGELLVSPVAGSEKDRLPRYHPAGGQRRTRWEAELAAGRAVLRVALWNGC